MEQSGIKEILRALELHFEQMIKSCKDTLKELTKDLMRLIKNLRKKIKGSNKQTRLMGLKNGWMIDLTALRKNLMGCR
ncbi:hypothetical protein [Virgibacillus phasianinus]|uniref:hypothetical protein n=1 Tax=Virgibacillus phasianinus TaxID=2017483 RepID=UPI0012FD1506|nr:hypothetical protein [Virgibacillus phasianinus]